MSRFGLAINGALCAVSAITLASGLIDPSKILAARGEKTPQEFAVEAVAWCVLIAVFAFNAFAFISAERDK